MFSPALIMDILNGKKTFKERHPKFYAFVSKMLGGDTLSQGSIIEITITKPTGEKLVSNMRVSEEDMDLFRKVKELVKR